MLIHAAFNTFEASEHSGAVVKWLSVRSHNAGVIISNPARVTIKAPLSRTATGNHLVKFTSVQKLRALSLVSAPLDIEYVAHLQGILISVSPFLCCPLA